MFIQIVQKTRTRITKRKCSVYQKTGISGRRRRTTEKVI